MERGEPGPLRPAIFLDRDGTIIENRDAYVRSWRDVAFVPGALAALAELARWPCAVVIVTNQSAVGRGLLSLDEAQSLDGGVCEIIERAGGRIDASLLCPHHPADGCDCRKPRPGLLLEAARRHDLALEDSWMIGDAWSDLEAGRAAGTRSLLVLTGRGRAQAAAHHLQGLPDLAAAFEHIRVIGLAQRMGPRRIQRP